MERAQVVCADSGRKPDSHSIPYNLCSCLKLLGGLLRKCQYQVTTTNEAITALKMLRENRLRFDLVIGDVIMPDMDGFKLLELVGLEWTYQSLCYQVIESL